MSSFQTIWIGGKYPGALPAHLHHVEVKRLKFPRPAKDEVLALARELGPISVGDAAKALGKKRGLVNFHLLDLEKEGLVAKEWRQNTHNKCSQMFYWGVQ